jgi:hypothetical protein
MVRRYKPLGGGRTRVRTALFMGAMVAKKYNPVYGGEQVLALAPGRRAAYRIIDVIASRGGSRHTLSHPLGAAAQSPRPTRATERRRREDGVPSSW